MVIIPVMTAGVLIGLFCRKKGLLKINAKLQIICTVLLLFAMGVSLDMREDFFQQLAVLGIQSAFFAIIPIVLSVAAVWFLTERFLHNKGGKK